VLLGAVMTGVAVVYHRWRQSGVLWLSIAVGLALGGLAALLSWLDGWHRLLDWFTTGPILVTLVLLPLTVAAACAMAAYAGLRRATP
jgi:hypothetical protein